MKKFNSVVLVFTVITISILTSENFLKSHFINPIVLYFGNLFFFLSTIISMLVQLKGLHHKNPNVFVRSVMGSMMIKMFLAVIAVFIYKTMSGERFNKRAILIALFFYLIYLAAEVTTILKLNKKQNA
jgi:hypothetical protein